MALSDGSGKLPSGCAGGGGSAAAGAGGAGRPGAVMETCRATEGACESGRDSERGGRRGAAPARRCAPRQAADAVANAFQRSALKKSLNSESVARTGSTSGREAAVARAAVRRAGDWAGRGGRRLRVEGDESHDAAAPANQLRLARQVHAGRQVVFVAAVLARHGEPVEELQADSLDAWSSWALDESVGQTGTIQSHYIRYREEALAPINMGYCSEISDVALYAGASSTCPERSDLLPATTA